MSRGRPRGARLVGLALLLAPGAAGAAPRDYAIDAEASAIEVHVGRSGAFGWLAGHSHDVKATGLRGSVRADPQDWSAGAVELELPASGLRVDASREPAGDAPKVQAAMETKVLELERHPLIRFRSTSVRVRGPRGEGAVLLEVEGALELHGVRRSLVVPVELRLEQDELAAQGRVRLRQTDFGIQPVSAGGGAVRVKDELALRFSVRARAHSTR